LVDASEGKRLDRIGEGQGFKIRLALLASERRALVDLMLGPCPGRVSKRAEATEVPDFSATAEPGSLHDAAPGSARKHVRQTVSLS
jgi:hypothetical protein